MTRVFLAASVLLLAPVLRAQTGTVELPSTDAVQLARLDQPTVPAFAASTSLPDAPSASFMPDVQAGVAANAGSAGSVVPPKYAGIVLPGQSALPLTAADKVVYGFHDAFSPFNLVSVTVSAGYSHLVDSQPHYGRNGEAFGKRVGVAALRSTVQAMATDAVFAPIFRTDPRYYEMGRGNNVFKRTAYAVSRVVVTRTDAGHHTVNAPLLLGYGVAAGLNNAYYPDRDTGAGPTLSGYAGSLGGAALGMVVNEFLDDALRIVHIRH